MILVALSLGCDQAQQSHDIGIHAIVGSPGRIAEKLGCEGEILGERSESQSAWMERSEYGELVEWDDAG